MLVKYCKPSEFGEAERIGILEAAASIKDICNNPINKYVVKGTEGEVVDEKPYPVLISARVLQVLSSKKSEQRNKQVQFDYAFTEVGQFAFSTIAVVSFKRMLSNLINNAVDAFDGGSGQVVIKVDATVDEVFIVIEDNGKGMPPELVNKIWSWNWFKASP